MRNNHKCAKEVDDNIWLVSFMQYDLGYATLRDYLLLILFTGLRRQEAAKLKWEQVDLKAKLSSLLTQKTENPTPYLCLITYTHFYSLVNNVLPMIMYFLGQGLLAILSRKQMAKVIEDSNISFTVHDLRRTFITIAESLDIPAYALKRLLNHRMNNDVTAGYIVLDGERLRKPMQLITDLLLSNMKIKDGAAVLAFHTPIDNEIRLI